MRNPKPSNDKAPKIILLSTRRDAGTKMRSKISVRVITVALDLEICDLRIHNSDRPERRLPQIECNGQTRNLRKGNAVATHLHRSVCTDPLHAPSSNARSLRDNAPDERALLLTAFAC